MKINHQTILITGGSSGIGLELAKVLIQRENTVLICGRSQEKLDQTKELLPEVNCFQCDISKGTERENLVKWVKTNFPQCNMLINNAAIVHNTDFYEDDDIVQKAENEIQTNLMAPIALTKMFMPVIEKNADPAIVNVSTGLVYVPRVTYPIYCATKSALHSFSMVLRHQLRNKNIRIHEVLMTVVDTPWHNGNAPKIAITPEKAVSEMVRKLEEGKTEIKIGKVKLLHLLSRIAPSFAFEKINSLTN